MKLIDKDAVLAEIEKIRRIEVTNNDVAYNGALDEIRYFLNTLEVKEVDLNEEIEKCLKKHSMLAVGKKDFTDIAKHFFELGLQTGNPLTWEDIDWIVGEAVCRVSEDSETEQICKEVLKRFKEQKGEKV